MTVSQLKNYNRLTVKDIEALEDQIHLTVKDIEALEDQIHTILSTISFPLIETDTHFLYGISILSVYHEILKMVPACKITEDLLKRAALSAYKEKKAFYEWEAKK